jgi:hypothetical protein
MFVVTVQNLRRAFELQSTLKWDTFESKIKKDFVQEAKGNMDIAKDIAFLTYLEMNSKRSEYIIKHKNK